MRTGADWIYCFCPWLAGTRGGVDWAWAVVFMTGHSRLRRAPSWSGWPTNASDSKESRSLSRMSRWILSRPMLACITARQTQARTHSYSGMITPACNADAGSATEWLAAKGSNRVRTTPRANAAVKTNTRSGFRFTVLFHFFIERTPSLHDVPFCPRPMLTYYL